MKFSGPFMFIGAVAGGVLDCVVLGIPYAVVSGVKKLRRRRRRKVWMRKKLENAIYATNRKFFGAGTVEFKRACISELRANGFDPPKAWIEELYQ